MMHQIIDNVNDFVAHYDKRPQKIVANKDWIQKQMHSTFVLGDSTSPAHITGIPVEFDNSVDTFELR